MRGGGGRIAIVHADTYRVEWIAKGKRTAGPVIPYAPVKIGSAEKDQWADAMAGATMMIRTMGGPGGGSGAARAMRPQRPNVDELEWPAQPIADSAVGHRLSAIGERSEPPRSG